MVTNYCVTLSFNDTMNIIGENCEIKNKCYNWTEFPCHFSNVGMVALETTVKQVNQDRKKRMSNKTKSRKNCCCNGSILVA